MQVGGIIGRVFSAIVDKLGGPADFTCSECERSARCGLPPTVDCIFRDEQLARGDWKFRREARRMLHSGM